jgi:hypothetical protein
MNEGTNNYTMGTNNYTLGTKILGELILYSMRNKTFLMKEQKIIHSETKRICGTNFV